MPRRTNNSQIAIFSSASLFMLLNLIVALVFIESGYTQPQSGLHPVTTLAEEADTVRVLNAGSAQTLILGSSDAQKKLWLYTVKNGAAVKTAEGVSLGHIWAATLFGSGSDAKILVAYGLGRGDLNAPLRVASYSLKLDSEKIIHTFPTERSQMNSLEAHGDRVIANYFVSKYETETGALTPVSATDWSYEKMHSIRMGTSVAVNGDALIIGRMYGDLQGQDGDVLFKKQGAEQKTLPSYRGVSSLALYKTEGSATKILIGDGWHSNYGQFAQGRLSLLTPVAGTSRYTLDLLHTFSGSYAVNRISPTGSGVQDPIVLATNNHLVVAQPGSEWSFTELYSQQNANTIFDVQYVARNGADILVLVADGKVALYKYSVK